MTDIRIVSKADLRETIADWLLLPNGTLDESEQLANIAKVALMTDSLAGIDDILPDPDSTDRRGWWGDYEALEIWGGWPIGTLNWLLTRAKIADEYSYEGATLLRAEEYTRTALAPLLERRIATHIECKATRVERERIDVLVRIYRGPRLAIELRFQDLWAEVLQG